MMLIEYIRGKNDYQRQEPDNIRQLIDLVRSFDNDFIHQREGIFNINSIAE